MDTNLFIQSLRRVIGRRGETRLIRCHNGSNFVLDRHELHAALNEVDHDRISEFWLTKGADWIQWKHNTPAASPMDGVWERQIRSACSILSL